MHVHRLHELSQVEPGYRVDPINDLWPVCPNCHAMLHRRQPALTIDEPRQFIRQPAPIGGATGRAVVGFQTCS